ncbi:MAG: gamma subclass chorismate mutase AroQ, partial [Gammaproteobacteria bacterium]|nr:gamma subclass chorismate mutase AroQ [Gammaproteobacteria bacterium]
MIRNSIFLCLLLLTPCFASADNQELFGLISERLSYMDEVATYKFIHGLPIEDLERENVVLDHAAFDGLVYGIKVETSRTFFLQQISAAKEIQRYWFEQFKTQPIPAKGPDLNDVIRPELVRLGESITRQLANDAKSGLSLENFLKTVDIEGLSTLSKQSMYEALTAIEFYDHRLQQILDSGVLRVGTTGDYAPFSFRSSPEAPFAGIDIDLANDLARSLDVEIRFVKTRWSSLLVDLKAGLYDIAMSGVSRNLDRQKVGFFSDPYHQGGKTPISLCKNRNKFNSLQKIDRKVNRIIVNPGGTNERFVDAVIKQAEKILHQDNRT